MADPLVGQGRDEQLGLLEAQQGSADCWNRAVSPDEPYVNEMLSNYLAEQVYGLGRPDHSPSGLLHVVRRVGLLLGELQQVTAAVGHDGWHSLEMQPEMQQTIGSRYRPAVEPVPRLGYREQASTQERAK